MDETLRQQHFSSRSDFTPVPPLDPEFGETSNVTAASATTEEAPPTVESCLPIVDEEVIITAAAATAGGGAATSPRGVSQPPLETESGGGEASVTSMLDLSPRRLRRCGTEERQGRQGRSSRGGWDMPPSSEGSVDVSYVKHRGSEENGAAGRSHSDRRVDEPPQRQPHGNTGGGRDRWNRESSGSRRGVDEDIANASPRSAGTYHQGELSTDHASERSRLPHHHHRDRDRDYHHRMRQADESDSAGTDRRTPSRKYGKDDMAVVQNRTTEEAPAEPSPPIIRPSSASSYETLLSSMSPHPVAAAAVSLDLYTHHQHHLHSLDATPLSRTPPNFSPHHALASSPMTTTPKLQQETPDTGTAGMHGDAWLKLMKLQKAHLCHNCEARPWMAPEAPVCRKCASQLRRQVVCRHCGDQFYHHRIARQAERFHGRTICLRCAKRLGEFGLPQNCHSCLSWASFGGKQICDRCTERTVKYGPPQPCVKCGVMAAFTRDPDKMEKVDNQMLCFKCTIFYKKEKNKTTPRGSVQHPRPIDAESSTAGDTDAVIRKLKTELLDVQTAAAEKEKEVMTKHQVVESETIRLASENGELRRRLAREEQITARLTKQVSAAVSEKNAAINMSANADQEELTNLQQAVTELKEMNDLLEAEKKKLRSQAKDSRRRMRDSMDLLKQYKTDTTSRVSTITERLARKIDDQAQKIRDLEEEVGAAHAEDSNADRQSASSSDDGIPVADWIRRQHAAEGRLASDGSARKRRRHQQQPATADDDSEDSGGDLD